jgi:hypothetical protein
MKMRKLKLLALIIFIPVAINAQSLDCPSKLKLMHAKAPYSFNNLSKSAQCYTGKKYEFMLPLIQGKDYRIAFYASPIFNNDINFRIIDMNSGTKVLDLPGENEGGGKGTSVLREYFDTDLNKMVHPYFDFHPSSSTTLKIIIDIASTDKSSSEATDESAFKAPEDRQKRMCNCFYSG